MRTAEMIDGGILVGHDGSKASSEAVVWAAGHAARLGICLHVLRAWSLTNAPRPASMAPGYVPPSEDFERAVLEQLGRDVEALHLPQDCTVELHAAHGQSSAKLLDAAKGAEMLVVGRRGAGGFRGLLTGSTADQVVRHSPCPVVVVPISDHHS
ncbi:universal stress protein [Nocardioides sp. Soil805]|uniref:universal stress protein n=1 Tax=Nocardioides sp. Soil805 TaxID=1736416 RepID=UPI001F3D99C4|nr:universal stress protein [Nocardioides sp. Soil805]